VFPEARQDRDKAKSALGVAFLHGLLGYALLIGFGVEIDRRRDGALKIFDVAVPPPPPTDTEPVATGDGPEGAASAPNLEAREAPVVAPRPKVRLDRPQPVSAAPETAMGSDSSAGAAQRVGPDQGSGGAGSGTGSGLGGNGSGGGGGAKARWLRGRIVDSDYPRAASRAGATGVVIVRFTVGPDGRASGCAIAKSSGNTELDATTCALIERRFRYEPARGADGRAVPSAMGWKQSWWQEPR
jgi:protein TonB